MTTAILNSKNNMVTPTIMSGSISRISVERSNDPTTLNAKRFVVSIMVPGTALNSRLPEDRLTFVTNRLKEIYAKIRMANGKTEEDRLHSLSNEEQEEVSALDTEFKENEIPATATTFKYFSTPLNSEESKRINAQQLRNAFPELMSLDDTKVFERLLTQRARFVGRPVQFTETEQKDKNTQVVKRDPKTNRPYTNIRLEASSDNITEADARALLGEGSLVMANPSAMPNDIPM